MDREEDLVPERREEAGCTPGFPETPDSSGCGPVFLERDCDLVFPDKPEKPEESDCCGSGCVPCIFDVYEGNVKKWERRCEEIRSNRGVGGGNEAGGGGYLSETRYKSFSVKSVESHTRDSRLFTFCVGEGVYGALGLGPGQHVIMKGLASNGSKVSRAYTVLAHRPGEFDVLARIYAQGRMSGYLATLRPGDIAHVRGPYGAFSYRPNAHGRVVMICAGTGLAPMYSVAQTIVDNESDETFVRLIYCERSVEDILLRSKLLALAEYWNFTARIYVGSDARETAPRYGEDLRYERVDRETLANELGSPGRTLVLICGADGFTADIKEHALALGVDKSYVFVF